MSFKIKSSKCEPDVACIRDLRIGQAVDTTAYIRIRISQTHFLGFSKTSQMISMGEVADTNPDIKHPVIPPGLVIELTTE